MQREFRNIYSEVSSTDFHGTPFAQMNRVAELSNSLTGSIHSWIMPTASFSGRRKVFESEKRF